MGRGRPKKCPHCGSTKGSTSKGFRYRAHDVVRDRKCRNCGRRYFVSVKNAPNKQAAG